MQADTAHHVLRLLPRGAWDSASSSDAVPDAAAAALEAALHALERHVGKAHRCDAAHFPEHLLCSMLDVALADWRVYWQLAASGLVEHTVCNRERINLNSECTVQGQDQGGAAGVAPPGGSPPPGLCPGRDTGTQQTWLLVGAHQGLYGLALQLIIQLSAISAIM